MTGSRQGGRARAVATAASLALHGVLLAWLAANVLPRDVVEAPPPPPDVILELQRPPTLRDARPSALTATTAPAPERELAPAAAGPRPLPLSPVRAAPAPPAPLAPLQAPPAPPAPARGPATAPAAGPPGRDAPARGAAQGERDGDVRGFLRATVGCEHADHFRLTPAERARCDSGFATAKGAPIGLPDDKLAAFAREADRNEAKRARNEGPLRGGFVPCDPAMVGANLSPGCLPTDAYARIRR